MAGGRPLTGFTGRWLARRGLMLTATTVPTGGHVKAGAGPQHGAGVWQRSTDSAPRSNERAALWFEAIEIAVRERCPVIGVRHSGGARLADGVDSVDAIGCRVTARRCRGPEVAVEPFIPATTEAAASASTAATR
jgi:acetyl-CoA carboxylase carboxyltransferase component